MEASKILPEIEVNQISEVSELIDSFQCPLLLEDMFICARLSINERLRRI